MSNDIEARVARLERTLEHGLGLDLAEHNDAGQAAAHAKQLAQDQADAEAQSEVAATAPAKELAEEQGVDLATVEPTGAEGQIVKADVAAAVEGSNN